MKIRGKSCVLSVVAAWMVICLLACSYADRIEGAWNGTGDFSINGDLYVTQIVFEDDGTGFAIGVGENVEFTYSLSDDIITVKFSENSHRPIPYEIDGDILTLDGRAVFTKVN